jgi:hypothetical protein
MKIFEQQTVRCCPCPECQRQPTSKRAEQHRTINRLLATLDERSRRLVVGLLAQQFGRGGIVRLAQITGLSRDTIRRGQRELAQPNPHLGSRVRRRGGGRKRVEKKMPRGSGRPGRPVAG